MEDSMGGRFLIALALIVAGCADADLDGVGGARDCDDDDPRVFKGATEVCDGVDNDCNGQIDEGVAIVAFQDRDGDGFGDPTRARRVCTMPEDGVDNDGDCNDFDPSAFPGADERCDLVDNDCDGETDEGLGSTFYADADGDGHGVPGDTTTACFVPEGYSRVDDDCDDADQAKWTDAPELCDAIDNDCDGETDEDVVEVLLNVDADGDGYGDPDAFDWGCGVTDGLVDNGLDCDDGDAGRSPETAEVPGNGVSDDCDVWVDELEVPGAFPTPEAALGAATDGSVVQLTAGVYTGRWDLTGRDLTFAGDGCGRTLLFGDGTGEVVLMDGGQVADLTITGGLDAGLRIEGDTTATGLCVSENHTSGFGGGIDVLGGTLDISDSVIAGNTSDVDGAGIHVGSGATLVGRRLLIAGNESSTDGGGMAVRSGTVTLTASVFAGNQAYDDGGAFASRELIRADPPGPPPVISMRNITFHRNRIVAASLPALADQAAGPVGYVLYDGDVRIEDSILTGHAVDVHPPLYARTPESMSYGTLLYLGNDDMDIREGHLVDAVRGDPLFVDDSSDDPVNWDLRLLPGSPAIDAAAGGLDPDGSAADLGGFGGPDAAEDFDGGYAGDRDDDGLPDAWEAARGTTPWLDDAAEDPDGDGLDHAAELAAGTDPFDADSDGDGIDDASDADPTLAADGAPVVVLQPVPVSLVDEAITVDASASWDQAGGALTWTWTLVPTLGSTVTTITGSGGTATFTPDQPGEWQVTVEVSNGSWSQETTRTVEVVDPTFVVPDDHADMAGALAAALDGDVIAVRPGTYPTTVDLVGYGLTIVGLGDADAVVLEGQGAGVVQLTDSASIELRHLTLADGDAAFGACLYCRDAVATLDDVLVRDSRATRSTFGGNGGGVWLSDCDFTATRLELRDNYAESSGGGLYATASDVRIDDLRVVDNVADEQGGGLWVRQRQDDIELSHGVLQGNSCTTGAALYLDGSTAYLAGTEPGVAHLGRFDFFAVVDNVGDSAVYVDDGKLRMQSPVLAHNDVQHVFDGMLVDTVALYVLFPTFWDNAGLPWADPAWAPRDVCDLDPRVLRWSDDGDASNDLWTLRPDSPLLDRGHPDVVDRDGTRSAVGPSGGFVPAAWARDSVDADGDGMSDGWELRYGLDVTVDDAGADQDGDGATNLAEYEAGTLP
jgi:hypothetical protein